MIYVLRPLRVMQISRTHSHQYLNYYLHFRYS
jgi:hypothetical protein